MTNSPPIVIIAGPTASGKSALALDVAQKRGGVIINADSQQMYRELRILTARPTEEEEERIPHRLYGVLSADEPCSAGKWVRMAKMEIDWIRANGQVPVAVGGTGLYLRALMEGMADIPDIDPVVRQQAQNDIDAMGHAAFHERLKAVDPLIAGKLRPTDTQRLVRAYAVWLGTGKPLSWWQEQKNILFYAKEMFEVIKVELEREELYERCNKRLETMFECGARAEVEALLKLNLSPDLPAMRIIGVPEITAWIRGEITEAEALARAQQATRNYAKRQLTWLRGQLQT